MTSTLERAGRVSPSARRRIEGEVEAVMPSGSIVDLPEEWRSSYAGKERKESPSSLVNFLLCPLKWFVERHLDLPPSDEVMLAGVVGTFVHRVLEVFYSERPVDRTKELLNRTFAHAWSALKDGDVEDGIVSDDLVREFQWLEEHYDNPDAMRGSFFNKARACITNIEDFDGDPADVRVVDNEVWVRAEVDGVLFRGKIDRIDLNSRGKEIIRDYKTGRAPQMAEDDEVDVLDLAFVPVGMYAWMRSIVRERDILVPEVASVKLLYLKELQEYSIRVTPELLERIDQLVHRVVEEMSRVAETGQIIAQPSESRADGQCRWCPIQNSCPVWTGDDIEPVREELGV